MTAVEIAIRNGEKMVGQYTCQPVGAGLPGQFFVQHNVEQDRCYIVNITPGRERCQCQQWLRTGCCKHEYFAHETRRIAEGEEIAEAKLICPVCSSFPLFDNDSTCDRCEKRAQI